jgi:hypothetical protein
VDKALDGAVLVFLIGVSFYAGVLAQRVASLELWRGEMNAHMDALFNQLRHLEKLIKNGND